MSWDSYIDNLLGHCAGQSDKSCIIGLDGSKYTTDGHPSALKITPTEAQAIARCFKTNDFSSMQASGVHVEGIKYNFLRQDDKVVLAKKKEQGAITMQAAKSVVVIAHTKEGCQQGVTNKGVTTIAEYLEGLGM